MPNIIRWAMGPAKPSGFSCLKVSIHMWKRLYGDSFDYYVCHNQLTTSQLDELNALGVKLVDQEKHRDSLKHPPFDTAWKLYPPRLDVDAHEIFIDNDLIIYRKAPWMDEYLSANDMFLVTSAHKRFYGVWDSLIPEDFPNINTGFFALPPHYDLQRVLNKLFDMYPGKHWQTHFDEEGAMTLLMMRKNLRIIPMADVYVANPGITGYVLGSYGTHFAGLNSGFDDYYTRYLK